MKLDIFYSSVNKLIEISSSKLINENDLINLNNDNKSEYLYNLFILLWNKKNKENNSKKEQKEQEKQEKEQEKEEEREEERFPLLWSILHQIIFLEFWYAGLCRLINDILVLCGPILIEKIVYSTQINNKQMILFYSTLLLISSLLQAIFLQQFIEYSFICGAKVTNTATTAVYHSSLKLKLQKIHPPKTIGEINNIQSKDASSLREFVVFAHNLWSCPMTVLGCVILIIRLLGWVGIISVIILSLFIPMESYIANKSRAVKKDVSKQADLRMGLIYELIDGIKTLKLTGLYDVVMNRISESRNKELSIAWYGRVLDASNLVISRLVPIIVVILTFGFYLFSPFELSSSTSTSVSLLDAPKVFATLSLINIMGRPISVIPKCISLYTGCIVSLRRIENLLLLSENIKNSPSLNSENIIPFSSNNQQDNQQNNQQNEEQKQQQQQQQQLQQLSHKILESDISIKFSNVTVYREVSNNKENNNQNNNHNNLKLDENKYITPLQNITCNLNGPGLVILIGDNGSGKTTFLETILDELHILSNFKNHQNLLNNQNEIIISAINNTGIVDYNPQIGYCSHDAWIMRDTIRRNIVMGDKNFNLDTNHIDERRYQEVIHSCCLEQDILQFSNGDMTVVGEKGVTISGGQKARVNLARALYSNAPILLLDCPLAGLDQQVSQFVFNEAIKKASKTKLVIMVTHQLDLIPYCDHLLILQNSKLIYDGTYSNFSSSQISNELSTYITSIKDKKHIEYEGEKKSTLGNDDKKKKINNNNNNNNNNGLSKDSAGGDIGTTSGSIWLLYWKYFESCSLYYPILGIILSISSFLFSAWSDWTLSFLADSTTVKDQQYYLYIYLIITFLILSSNIIRYLFFALSGIRGSQKLHTDLTTSIVSAPIKFFDETPSGRIISRFSADMDTIDNAIPSSLSTSCDAYLGVIIGISVVVVKSPAYLLLILPLTYKYIQTQNKYRKASVELKKLDSSSKSPVFSHFNETLTGLTYIRGYQIQNVMIIEHHNYLNKNITARYNWDATNRWLGIRLDIIGALIVAGAAYCLLFVDINSSNGGSAGLMVSYALKSTASLSLAIRTSTSMENMFLSFSRVLEYIGIQSEVSIINETNSYQDNHLITSSSSSSPSSSNSNLNSNSSNSWFISLFWKKKIEQDEEDINGDIESAPLLNKKNKDMKSYDADNSSSNIVLKGSHITVRYHPTFQPVLVDVNFELKKGKIIGLSGRTGGGKSTLASVICRVIANDTPCLQITLNGKSIYKIPLKNYRKNDVNLFPQDSYLFSGTVRDAVDPYHLYSNEIILAQLQRFSNAIISEKISNNNNDNDNNNSTFHLMNLNFQLTSNGGNISAGEKQILVLVRASLSKAKIVILDEITSHMTIQTANVAVNMLRSDLVEKNQASVILICHRPEDMALCDEVWELSNGHLNS